MNFLSKIILFIIIFFIIKEIIIKFLSQKIKKELNQKNDF